MISLRPFDLDTDVDSFVTILNAEGGGPTTAQRIREDRALMVENQKPFYEVSAVLDQGTVVGFGFVGPVQWQGPDKIYLRVLIGKEWRGRGIGTMLFDDAWKWAQTQGATTLLAGVRDDDPASLTFMEKRGFSVARQRFVSVLDVPTFDETRFSAVVPEVEASGIRLVSLAELGDTLEIRRKLYDINILAAADEPAHDGTLIPYDEFSKMVFDAWWFRADGQFLALDGDRMVGIAAVGHNREQNQMFNAFTGTDPAYRGRKIALALKLKTIQLAKQEGIARIRTNNDSLNPAMLAINHKLGYVRQPGQYQLQRPL